MLDNQLEALMRQARAAGVPDLGDLPPQAARGLYRQIVASTDAPLAGVETRDLRIPGPAGLDITLGLRIHTPRGAGPYPTVVYYHGGGYVVGDPEAYDGVCRQLCVDVQAVVVAVNYRLAPEHPYPAAVEDAWAALQWVASPLGAQVLGPAADTQRLAVAGDSAGATLATVMTLLAREAGAPRIACQSLVYPPAAGGHDGDYPSRTTHGAGPTLTLRTMDYFSHHYFGPSRVAPDFRGAPLQAASLAGLPPTLLMLASHDPLRDEALAYGHALSAAGNAVSIVEYHGLAHGFITMASTVDAARIALRHLADHLKAALA
jgi:acetyl esterase